jgi:hypothetical protein
MENKKRHITRHNPFHEKNSNVNSNCFQSDFSRTEKQVSPFKLIAVKPDTAIIERFLRADIDSVQSDFAKRYFHSIQEMEKLANTNDFSNDSSFKFAQEKIKHDLVAARAAEPGIKKF